MMDDKIKSLLQKADRMAAKPQPISPNLTTIVHRRAYHRHLRNNIVSVAVAAVVLIALGIWSLTAGKTNEQQKIVALETQIKQLHERTDVVLNLVQEVLEHQRKQRHLDELKAQLASITDPLEETRRQIDKTAFILVYQANRMYTELNQKSSAVQAYNRVIELFPQTKWAEVARQRLSEIQNKNINGQVEKEI